MRSFLRFLYLQAQFCAQYLPQFFAAFDALPPATTPLTISVLHSYACLWGGFNGHAHISRYLIHHPKGREVAASLLKHVDACTPAKSGVRLSLLLSWRQHSSRPALPASHSL